MSKTENSFTDKKRLKINDQIRAKEVRVIGPDGNQVGILSVKDALVKAREHQLDLIEIAPQAKPPVCRIGDFGKMRYELTKKEKQLKKNSHQQVVKTIRLKPNIGENDLLRQISHIEEFLDKGYRVIVQIRFKGRESKFLQLANQQVIGRICQALPNAQMDKPSYQDQQIIVTFMGKTEDVKN